MEVAEVMLTMVDDGRYYSENDWLNIGKALYTASGGAKEGLISWIEHTQAICLDYPAYYMTEEDDSVFNTSYNLYFGFEDKIITLKTLAWYARIDSPELYSDWHDEWCGTSMQKALSYDPVDIAGAIQHVFWLDLVFYPDKNGHWFEFIDQRWIEIEQNIRLIEIISDSFVKKSEYWIDRITDRIKDSKNNIFKNFGIEIMSKILNLIEKLKQNDTVFINKIIEQLRIKFSNGRFFELLDTNSNIIGFPNGVLETSNKSIQFRSSKPEDYLFLFSPIIYSEFKATDSLVIECGNWLKQVFPEKLFYYFLLFSSSCLKRNNNDKIINIFIGKKNSCLNLIIKLYETIFGASCLKIESEFNNRKNKSITSQNLQNLQPKQPTIQQLDLSDLLAAEPTNKYKSIVKNVSQNTQILAPENLPQINFPRPQIRSPTKPLSQNDLPQLPQNILPTYNQPTINQPPINQPTINQPSINQPTIYLTINQSSTINSTIINSNMNNSIMINSNMNNSTMNNSGMNKSSTINSNMDNSVINNSISKTNNGGMSDEKMAKIEDMSREKNTHIVFIDHVGNDDPIHKIRIMKLANTHSGKLILLCDKMPKIVGINDAFKSNIRFIPFISQWVDDPPTDPTEQVKQNTFKYDPKFEERIPYLAPVFLWLMKQFYVQSIDGINEPPIVSETIKKY